MMSPEEWFWSNGYEQAEDGWRKNGEPETSAGIIGAYVRYAADQMMKFLSSN